MRFIMYIQSVAHGVIIGFVWDSGGVGRHSGCLGGHEVWHRRAIARGKYSGFYILQFVLIGPRSDSWFGPDND